MRAWKIFYIFVYVTHMFLTGLSSRQLGEAQNVAKRMSSAAAAAARSGRAERVVYIQRCQKY